MKRVIKFAVIKSEEAHEFKDCLHRVRRLEEQLELSQQVSGTIEKKNCPQCLAMFTNCSVNVNLMNCNVNVNANCKQ